MAGGARLIRGKMMASQQQAQNSQLHTHTYDAMSVMTVRPEQDEDTLEPLFQTFFFWIWNHLGAFPLKVPEKTIFPNPPKKYPVGELFTSLGILK